MFKSAKAEILIKPCPAGTHFEKKKDFLMSSYLKSTGHMTQVKFMSK